jgi:hypothetical protein
MVINLPVRLEKSMRNVQKAESGREQKCSESSYRFETLGEEIRIIE